MRKLISLIASLVLLPVRFIDGTIRYVLQLFSPPPAAQDDEAAVARQAAAQAHQQQTRADDAQDAREVVQHLRRVLSARSRGQVPDAEHVSRLPGPLMSYVSRLSSEECGMVVSMPAARLRDLVNGKPVHGIRSPDDIASSPADELAARRAVSREDVRARFRGRTLDDVLRDDVRLTA